MKSGYGAAIKSRALLTDMNGNILPGSGAYTLPQYAYALYPEYGYSFEDGKASTLEHMVHDGQDIYELNTAGSTSLRFGSPMGTIRFRWFNRTAGPPQV